MSEKKPEYYLKSSSSLGWGEDNALLDMQRVKLLEKYIEGKKILDVGCGQGIYVDFLVSKGFDGWGVDFVEEFVKRAKKGKKGSFVLGKAEKLPFPDKSFDTVLLFDIVEHADEEKVLKEAKRVARKKILVIVPRQVDYELEKAGVVFRHYIDKSHLKEYAENDFENLAKKTGLKLVHLEKIHSLYNETIFLSLFCSPLFFTKIIRKIVFLILKKRKYFTEFFAVYEI